MFDINFKNNFFYKIYKILRKGKKNKNIMCVSLGSDSITSLKFLKNIKFTKLIQIYHNNHVISEYYLYKFMSIFNFYKIKLKKKKNEKSQRILRFKNLKNFCIYKKFRNITTFQNYNDSLEYSIINLFLRKNLNFIKKDINNIRLKLLKKVKPLFKTKKKYVKLSLLKTNYKWFEDESNIKWKNIRNKIRINIMETLKLHI